VIARLPLIGRRAHPEWRDRRVQELVAHAYRRVPYYRRLFDAHGVHPDRIKGVADLTLVPTTTRRELARLAPSDRVAGGLAAGPRWLEQRRVETARAQALEEAGVRWGDRLVCLGGASTTRRERRMLSSVLEAAGLPLEQTLPDHGSPDETAARLAAMGADVVLGRASALAALADAWGGRAGVRLILSGGEPLTPGFRDRIERGFGSPVRAIYCSPEFGLMAWECRSGGSLHTCAYGVVLEVLGSDDRPVAAGGVGEVVATNLHGLAAPLIRVRTGDHAALLRDCRCGEGNLAIGNLVRGVRDEGSHPRGATGGEAPRVA
jgi:phenylacetate-CoA ligase